jgi:hypothetical protein
MKSFGNQKKKEFETQNPLFSHVYPHNRRDLEISMKNYEKATTLDSILTDRYLNLLFFVRGFLLRTSAWSRVVGEFPFHTHLRKKFVKIIATTPWKHPENPCVLP